MVRTPPTKATFVAFPYLQDLVRALTGADLPLPIPMFGLSLVLSVLAATWVFRLELRRLWDEGRLAAPPTHQTPQPADVPAADDDGPEDDAPSPSAKSRPRHVTDRRGLDDFVTTFGLWMLLAGVAGARLFSAVEDPAALARDPGGILLSRSGFNVIGGLVVATLVGIALIRRAGLRVRPAMDAAAPAMMLGYSLGRIGCQVSGDGDWGLPAALAAKPAWLPTWLWAQHYEGNILGVTIPAPGVYPTPIWETVACLVLFAVLWRVRRHPFAAGWLFSLYAVLAAAERLAIEPLRVNERYGPLHASQAQYLSGVALVVGLGFVIALSRRRGLDATRTTRSPRDSALDR